MKYSIDEIERRWLAINEKLPDLENLERTHIFDKYLDNSRMRLRKMQSDNEVIFKLCKKYGKNSPISEPITNIYLSEAEYNIFNSLAGKELKRIRYYYLFNGIRWAINLSEGIKEIIVELEFSSIEDAINLIVPDFCGLEISDSPEWEAHNFAI